MKTLHSLRGYLISVAILFCLVIIGHIIEKPVGIVFTIIAFIMSLFILYLGIMYPKVKMYIYLSFTNKRKMDWKFLPLAAGIMLQWRKYRIAGDFSAGYYPKGKKSGIFLFEINIGFMYWSASFTFYKPDPVAEAVKAGETIL
ncbi:MAG: hypothetical protein PHT07_14950 [Paludibacter sp.]|nr:hypothetical protein [Paludibacter sp.]